MTKPASKLSIARALLSNPRSLRVKPSVNWFLCQYLRKFRAVNVGGNLILHSHLPPLNSTAYSRFIKEHLLNKHAGPSHAQIGLTNACPQNCEYCYSKNKKGKAMSTETIIDLIHELKQMGVFWLGFTGGEPLLNRDIVRITEAASDECAVKLFTTGCTLTRQRADDLKQAGLFSVSVSLDHWKEVEHDRVRRYPGAFRTAINALNMFKAVGGIHVGVSAVISKDMIRQRQVEEFLSFLETLEIDEAWLSEAKPSIPEMWSDAFVLGEDERIRLCHLQDRYNRKGKMTVNYLGHFEGKEHFGCSAGNKMVYVDACGSVSPCVFLAVSFGNVHQKSMKDIYAELKRVFPTEDSCFVNKNLGLLQKYSHGRTPLSEKDTLAMMEEIRFGPMARFFQLHYA